jgi:hypothetical protein
LPLIGYFETGTERGNGVKQYLPPGGNFAVRDALYAQLDPVLSKWVERAGPLGSRAKAKLWQGG